MKLRELEMFSKQLAISVKSHISNVLTPITTRLEQLENDIKNANSINLDDVALTAASLIDTPKNGINGKDGNDGTDGKNGVDGTNGKSVYELAVDNGFSGSLNDWLIGLKGIDGKDGAAGKDGDNGLDGTNGIDGKDGADGNDGLNALDIDILPGIDEEKDYKRGIYAIHNGGLWRSHSTTKGLRGWECIVNGISSINIEQSDPRSFNITVSCSNGETEVKQFSIPTLIYKGVFQNGNTYQKGDTVTWAGSLWHCDEETADKPGEINSKGWTLAAKRGRDGKDK